MALVALAAELIVLAWLVGVHVWEWAGAAIAEWYTGVVALPA